VQVIVQRSPRELAKQTNPDGSLKLTPQHRDPRVAGQLHRPSPRQPPATPLHRAERKSPTSTHRHPDKPDKPRRQTRAVRLRRDPLAKNAIVYDTEKRRVSARKNAEAPKAPPPASATNCEEHPLAQRRRVVAPTERANPPRRSRSPPLSRRTRPGESEGSGVLTGDQSRGVVCSNCNTLHTTPVRMTKPSDSN